ncbi:MAG: CAAX prenyl protease-related protein [Acidobacteriota bacterium]|jgi:CAAX prenyl protease-like protein|nr:CAAX prenyl protease-related protein [Acidobacteriota bacterium]
MINKIIASPVLVRVVPFAAFAALTIFQGQFGDEAQYWVYGLKTILGAWILWLVRSHIKELKWNFSWEALIAGVAVFVIWVGMDGHFPMLTSHPGSFNPVRTYGEGSVMAMVFIAVRILGSSLVVPPLEEIFYRSFIYRYLIKSDFLQVPLNRLDWRAFLIAGVVFGVGHYEWLPGILCAFTYQWLVIRKNRLGDAITAHAITNFLLGIWVVTRDAYIFW